MKPKYHNDDITFCAKSKCKYKDLCDRHIENYKGYKPYVSIADLENTIYCLKKAGADKRKQVQTMAEYINKEAAYDYATLEDWYIISVTDDEPVWTEEHLEELLNDFYVIPKDTPAADVVEVIRCGKCRHYNRRWGCRKLEINVSADNYCFLAEPAVADSEVILPNEE